MAKDIASFFLGYTTLYTVGLFFTGYHLFAISRKGGLPDFVCSVISLLLQIAMQDETKT